MADKRKPSLYRVLLEDVGVLSGVTPSLWSVIRCFFGRSGFQAVVFYRLSVALGGKSIPGRVLGRFFARLNTFMTGCDIDRLSVIGPGLKLPHPSGIVIGPCVIGRNAMILQHTTIGLRHFSDDELDPGNFPVIGDNVVLSAGAVILGSVRIGDNAAVGANAVVLSDVPNHCTAVGIPARIVSRP